MRPSALFLSLLALSAAPSGALAQGTPPSLDLRGFRAPLDPASGLYLAPADSPATGAWIAPLWMNYVYRPITLRDTATGDIAFDVIGHQITSDLTASVGIAHRVLVGLDMPIALYQSGDEPTEASRRTTGDLFLPNQALGDLGLNAKLTLIRPTRGDLGGFALALSERFTVPTGDEASFLGEGSVTSETRVLGEYRLVAVALHATAGVKVRGYPEAFACGSQPIDACKSRFGHELPFGLGLAFRPQALGIDEKGRWTWTLESRGRLPLYPIAPFQSTAASLLTIGIGARYALRDVSFFAGLEAAPLAGVGAAPLRATLSVAWAPRSHDADGDGIDDEVDQCSQLPEDKDGFQDDDGCPDLDNDDDGVVDADDQCPAEKEDEDGYQDDDGCPDLDNDGDRVLDEDDACPNTPGDRSVDPKTSGCPIHDADHDGIQDDKDKCPAEPEDKDGYQDEDGCPDLDNDGDGVSDAEDACPNEPGVDTTDARDRGCPDQDPDKDTFLGSGDKCPDEAEVWNGIDDGDGCPDAAPQKKLKPLVTVKETKKGPVLEVEQKVTFTPTHAVDTSSLSVLRALASEMLRHPTWTVAIGVRTSSEVDEAAVEKRAAAVAQVIRRFARRENAATTVPWGEVKSAPRALEFGIGFTVLVPQQTPADRDRR